MAAAVPVNPVNPAQHPARQGGPPAGALGNHRASNITDDVKKEGLFEKGVGGAKKGFAYLKKEWRAMSREERGYYAIAAICFLVAIALLVAFALLMGPAALPIVFTVAQPLSLLGAMALGRALAFRKRRKAQEPPTMPKAPSKVNPDKWKEKWEAMQAAKDEMQRRCEEFEFEKGKVIREKRINAAGHQVDITHQMALQAAYAQAAHKFMVAKSAFQALKPKKH